MLHLRSMTVKQFWIDPYQTRQQTQIRSVDGVHITLESTIFFAFSGGQESDEGTIGGLPVLQAQKKGKEIIYTLPAGHSLSPGDAVEVIIDWPRRYTLMRLHFAAELVLALVYRALPSVEKLGPISHRTKPALILPGQKVSHRFFHRSLMRQME